MIRNDIYAFDEIEASSFLGLRLSLIKNLSIFTTNEVKKKKNPQVKNSQHSRRFTTRHH